VTTHAFSVHDRVGMLNTTSGITKGKHNFAVYAAFPDESDDTKVSVLGYAQLYYIKDQPTCCKATLDIAVFKSVFQGKSL
jgi:hypothetical protein